MHNSAALNAFNDEFKIFGVRRGELPPIKINPSFWVWFMLLVQLLGAQADEPPFTRKVLLPDGSPAAGVSVLVHHLPISRNEVADKRLKTDAQGILRVAKRDFRQSIDSFVMVDAPGCALSFWTEAFRENAFLPLKTDTPLRGRIVDTAGRPVAGAKVLVREWDSMYSESWTLNDANRKVRVPQLITYSKADGRFVLRGIDGESYPRLRLHMVAQAIINGRNWSGETLLTTDSGVPRDVKNVKLVIEPAVVIQGLALNATTRKPLAGVSVRLRVQHWSQPNAPVVTGADGKFAFEASPGANNWGINAQAKGFMTVAARLKKSDIGRRKPAQVFNITCLFRSPVILHGRVIDADTSRPPVSHVIVVAYPLETARKQGPVSVFGQESATSIKDDGTFEMPVGAGKVRLEAMAHFGITYGCLGTISQDSIYRLDTPQQVTVTQNQREVELRVRKNPGILMRFERLRTSREGGFGVTLSIESRTADGKIQGLGFGNPFFIPTANWGEGVDIRVIRFKEEIVPWTRIVADPATWPVIISSPETPQ